MRFAPVVAALALIACDVKPGADASATIQGTVAGRSIASPGATGSGARTVVSPASTVVTIAVHVAPDATTCGALSLGAGPALDLAVHVEGANVPAITAGDFAIGQTTSGDVLTIAGATFTVAADGGAATPLAARSGSITFSSVTPARIAGRFDLVFVTGDHLTGTFDAIACGGAVDDAGLVSPADASE